LDILFWFVQEFFFGKFEDKLLGVGGEMVSRSIDSIDFRQYVWGEAFDSLGFIVVL